MNFYLNYEKYFIEIKDLIIIGSYLMISDIFVIPIFIFKCSPTFIYVKYLTEFDSFIFFTKDNLILHQVIFVLYSDYFLYCFYSLLSSYFRYFYVYFHVFPNFILFYFEFQLMNKKLVC